MTPFTAFLITLATLRLSFALVKENGPFDIFQRLRNRTTIGGMLECMWCTSVWAAIALYFVFPHLPEAIYILAFSCGAMLLWRYTGGDFS